MADSKYNAEVFTERSHYLIQPSDNAQRIVLEKVEHACRSPLISDYHIQLNPGYMTTIACVYVEAIIRTMVRLRRETRGEETTINFLDLFTVSSSNRENDDADKDGNINVKFTPGKIVEEIMDRDYAPVIHPDMWRKTIIEVTERECSKILQTKHKMQTNTTANWTIIAYVYIQYLFRTLKYLTKAAAENGKSMAMINFLEMFELHGTIEEIPNEENPDLIQQKFDIKIRPGFQSKLLIKDDDTTELDEED